MNTSRKENAFRIAVNVRIRVPTLFWLLQIKYKRLLNANKLLKCFTCPGAANVNAISFPVAYFRSCIEVDLRNKEELCRRSKDAIVGFFNNVALSTRRRSMHAGNCSVQTLT